jgi:hypothetical protein
MLGRGSGQLPFSRVFRLGSAPVETAWRHAGFRSVAALFADARKSLHLIPLDAPGPAAYWNPDGRDPLRVQGNVLVAASLQLQWTPFRARLLRPLQMEGFFGIGQTWFTEPTLASRYTFGWDRFLADAGVGLGYNVSDLPGLRRWTALSELLQDLRLRLRVPLWVSDPDLIGERDALRFRWMLGIVVGP